jgi:hypothetical protein
MIEESHGQSSGITLRRGLLIERLELEAGMQYTCGMIVNFFIYFSAFMLALNSFFPAGQLANVHGQLRAHFGIDADTVLAISTVEDVFDFIKNFEEMNLILMPTSKHYWCDPRFLHEVQVVGEYGAGDGGCGAGSGGGGHRRLSETTEGHERRLAAAPAGDDASYSSDAGDEEVTGVGVEPTMTCRLFSRTRPPSGST